MLGVLALGEEMTGNDVKKWADWSLSFFYWSPSVSQVYGELKKLEKLGFVRSRSISEPGARSRRVYSITPTGVGAVRAWSREAPVEAPVLKHGVMLRMYLGHLNEPEKLKSIVRDHIANLEENLGRVRNYADHSDVEPSWAFPLLSLRWSERYFRTEIALFEELLDEIDEAAARFACSDIDENGVPHPRRRGSWRTVEQTLSAHDEDGGDGPAPAE
ncbi:PadR family transcriptional regulator [Rhodococcus ruber]|uniref:PadR family transcriptional regulator n=1 Tax=Rhodococcus ruber BKS 20-38 TaxID=1278076 RepID=M2X8B1_9NOCA|nr:PadR family transcriptional regulator [Rhodococcus ruber]EME57331.1 PadR family transcriptional regulator [Rhodococcus ruber BKS 20-38]